MGISNPLSVLLSTAVGAVGAIGGAVGFAWYASNKINPVPRRIFKDGYTFTPWELGVPYEDVTLQTPDDLNLSAWWLPCTDASSLIIGCHSHVGAKHNLLGIGTGLWRNGYNVLLFDFRGRGDSDPWPNTLADCEVQDLMTVVQYARSRMPEARIGVIGYSMGAAVAILAAVQEPAIKAIIADSSFTSATDVVAYTMQQMVPFPAEPLMALTDAVIAQRHGYHLKDIRPIDAVGQLSPRPLLIIHSTDDTVTPLDHAYQLFEAANHPKELWVSDGNHCGAYFADRCGYVQRVNAFFDQYLRCIE